jgi:octaprenyl-diphosphate synthase
LAYQIYDDCQDVFGREEAAGKSLGTDLAKGKLTLPWIELRQRVHGPDLVTVKRIFQEGAPNERDDLRQILADYDVFAACERAVLLELDRARGSLELLDCGRGPLRLAECGDFLAAQMNALGRGV